jgi:hypothetical protein
MSCQLSQWVGAAGLLVLLGCASSSGSGAVRADLGIPPALLGRWSTGLQMSQLGPSVVRLTLRPDGSCELRFHSVFIHLGTRGTCRTEGDKLLLEKTKCPVEDAPCLVALRFELDRDHLVITEESGAVYRYHRIGH